MSILAQIGIFCIIVIPVALIAFIVSSDARKRGISGGMALLWVFVSILSFPIGFLLYFLLRGQSSGKNASGG